MAKRIAAISAIVVAFVGALSLERLAAQDAEDLDPRINEVEPRIVDVTSRVLEVEARIVDVVVTSESSTEIPIASDVLFAFGSAELTTEAQVQLAGVVDRIRAATASRVMIEGHTDAIGDDDANQRLSEARAETVRAYLTSQAPGLSLDAGGFGETRPVAPNELLDGSDNPSGRQQNRRVTVVLEP